MWQITDKVQVGHNLKAKKLIKIRQKSGKCIYCDKMIEK